MRPTLRISTFAWIVSVGLLIAVMSTGVVAVISVRNADQVEQTWTQFETVANKKSLLLSQVRGLLGYNGMIHHFKNFVLRAERGRIIIVHEKLLELRMALTAFDLLGVDEVEDNALSALLDTAQQYREALAIAEKMSDEGQSPAAIDAAVRLDDAAAIQALAVLERSLTTLQKANAENVSRLVHGLTLFTRLSGPGLIAILLPLAALTVWFSQRRLIHPLRSLINAFENVNPADPAAVRLSTGGRHSPSELAALAHAGNTFIDSIREYCDALRSQKAQTAEVAIALTKEKEINNLHRQFVSMVSHEFRTPLAIIDGAAQRITRRLERLSPDDIRGRAGTIRGAVKRMTVLIDSTLSVARLDAGSATMVSETMELAPVIVAVCARQEEISDTRKISVDAAGIKVSIVADPAMLDQVFSNLLSNAVKYSPDGSPITVKGWMEGEQVFISIRDYGVGIPDKDLPRIFERFFRAGTSAGIVGTGIGLHLVKQLVEMHGGSVAVESVEGEGSTFTVRLPVKPAVDTTTPDPAALAAPVAA